MYWKSIVDQFFSPDGMFRHTFHVQGLANNDQQEEKVYEISYSALPRYLHAFRASGVESLEFCLSPDTYDRILPNGHLHIEHAQARMIQQFEVSRVEAIGQFKATFNPDQKLVLLEFISGQHEEMIPRSMVIDAAKPQHNWNKEWKKMNSMDSKQSPELSKKGKAKQLKSPPNQPPDVDLPEPVVATNMGITNVVQRFLEMYEVMSQMQPLMDYSVTNPGLSVYQTLEQYNATHVMGGPQPIMNGQQPGGMQGNPRTPSFGQFPMGASPATGHRQLPNSPHINGSPAQGNMAAPAMVMQQSQQGTSSSGPSANTSPSVSNKRRRASAVKPEDDGPPATPNMGATPQLNGVAMSAKTKPPTPRIANQKRVKTKAS
jgi:hypothetical protein